MARPTSLIPVFLVTAASGALLFACAAGEKAYTPEEHRVPQAVRVTTDSDADAVLDREDGEVGGEESEVVVDGDMTAPTGGPRFSAVDVEDIVIPRDEVSEDRGFFGGIVDGIAGLFGSDNDGDSTEDKQRAKAPTTSRPSTTATDLWAFTKEGIDRSKSEEKHVPAPLAAVQKALGQRLLADERKRLEYNRQTLDFGLGDYDETWIIARADTTEPAPSAPRWGEMRTRIDDVVVPLPLKHTDVDVRVSAYIASVRVKQQYHNPYDITIEAIYVFPLPHNAAVSEFVMVIGDRRIRGIIREREEAERVYAAAKRAGHIASLLTQERPNIFTQKVANIDPGRNIDIELTYYNTLAYKNGGYELVYPMVVGPRYNPPGDNDGIGAVGWGQKGRSGHRTEVQYLKPDQRSGHDISLSVELDASVEILSVSSSSHEVDVEFLAPERRRIRLARKDSLANEDFVLHWKIAGDEIKTGFLAHQDERGTFFTLVLEPPADLEQISRAPVEMIFVLDCSGSMSGTPLRKAKRVIARIVRELSPRDTFQIIRFSDDTSKLGPRPVAVTPANIKRGLRYLDSLQGSGGTQMIEGIKAALDFPHEDGRVRLVSFMTDGFIGNELEILGAIHEKLGYSRLFSFGVGSSPNRYLLERMAKMGQGAVAYVSLNDGATDDEIYAFYQRIAHPAFSDIEIDWGGAQVTDVYPSRIPDLHVGRPVVITGRLRGDLPASVSVRGHVAGAATSYEVPISTDTSLHRPAVAQIWARMKIMDLMDRTAWEPDLGQLAWQIRETALEWSLMSKWTAFVAVDATSQALTESTTVTQPVPVPRAVRYDSTVTDAH